MPQIHILKFKLAEPVRSSCGRCGGPRYLIRIERAELSCDDKHTYECAQCGNVITGPVTIETQENSQVNLRSIYL
jgi:uncharacterized Zn finger protein